MASVNFQVYDRTLRRMFMSNLVYALSVDPESSFRASLVFNPHTGLPTPSDLDYEAELKANSEAQSADQPSTTGTSSDGTSLAAVVAATSALIEAA